MTDRQRWILVSDSHLRRDPGVDTRNPGQALARFIRANAFAEGIHTTLILLGDIFELLDDLDPDPGPALDAILAAHPDVIRSLREAAGRGTRLAVVPGNHDAALATPRIWDRFVDELGADVRVDLFPWVAYVPGVFYAEHGHQHHDVNRMPTLLMTYVGRSAPFEPPLAAAGPVEAGKAFIASWRSEQRSARSDYYQLLREEATRLRLPTNVVRSLHKVSRFRPFRTAGRIVEVRAGRTASGNEAEAERQAAKVAGILDDANLGVAAIVFGHTHRARHSPLTKTTTYLNTGTWTADVRGSGPDAVDPHQFPYVEITREDGAVKVAQRYFALSRTVGQQVDREDLDAIDSPLGAGTPNDPIGQRAPRVV